MKVLFENVNSVYSGRPGCCCGCRGKHTHRKGRTENDYDTVNDVVVRRHLETINANIDKATIHRSGLGLNVGHVAVELGNRIYIAYLLSTDGLDAMPAE